MKKETGWHWQETEGINSEKDCYMFAGVTHAENTARLMMPPCYAASFPRHAYALISPCCCRACFHAAMPRYFDSCCRCRRLPAHVVVAAAEPADDTPCLIIAAALRLLMLAHAATCRAT